MLSRVCTRPLLVSTNGLKAAAVGCRHMATATAKPPPPKQATPHTPPKPAPATPTPQPKATSVEKDFDFNTARAKLPLRLSSPHGLLASVLYAESDFKSKAEVDAVGKSLYAFDDEVYAKDAVSAFLFDPVRPNEQKKALISSLTKALNSHPSLESFLHSMVDANAIDLLPHMVPEYESLVDARDKKVTVTVTLASQDQPKPKPETVRRLMQFDSDAKVELLFKYDPTIVGGAIIATQDRMLDFSFQKELNGLQAELESEEAKKKSEKVESFNKQLAEVVQAAKEQLAQSRGAQAAH